MKGNITSDYGLTVAYASYKKPASITRGTTTIGFSHDPEHQRFQQTAPGGTTLYLGMAEKFTGSGGAVRWTNYLTAAGGLVGMHVENSDETVSTRYFHKDHLGSIAVITDESGAVLERLSFDAWGKRRHPNGSDDPAGSITSQTSRGFTGHEELDSVGLVHMNGRVYDPLLARFGTADPITESPFSTQGWNRYSYVGNSPLNFTDPSGYCFLGCFWKSAFRAVGSFFRENWRSLVQIAAVALICGPGAPICAGIVTGVVVGVTSGDLGLALRSGLIAGLTAGAFEVVGNLTGNFEGSLPWLGGHGPLEFGSPAHLFNMAGHAAVGCGSAVASGGKCGPGALSGAVGSFAGPLLKGLNFGAKLVATSVLGGLASVAGGGKFGNGAMTAAFGYLFNEVALACRGVGIAANPVQHCGLFVYDGDDPATATVRRQYTMRDGTTTEFEPQDSNSGSSQLDLAGFRRGNGTVIAKPEWLTQEEFERLILENGDTYKAGTRNSVYGPNSNSAVEWVIIRSGAQVPQNNWARGLDYWRRNPPY